MPDLDNLLVPVGNRSNQHPHRRFPLHQLVPSDGWWRVYVVKIYTGAGRDGPSKTLR